MPSETLNQYQISGKVPFIIHANLKWLIEKIDGCKNNPKNSSTTKLSKYIPSDFSISSIFWFRSIENNHDVNTEVIKR